MVEDFFGMLSIILIKDSLCGLFWMLTSVFCSVKTVIQVFICVETGVIKLLLVFVFFATLAVSVNDSDVSFVATNVLMCYCFLFY